MAKIRTQELPNDSQIVMQVFRTFLIFILLTLRALIPFRGDITPDLRQTTTVFNLFSLNITFRLIAYKRGNVLIVQRSGNPPHCDILFNEETWAIHPVRFLLLYQTHLIFLFQQGHNNIFYCILMFVHCVATRFNGFLDQMAFGSQPIDILKVLKAE